MPVFIAPVGGIVYNRKQRPEVRVWNTMKYQDTGSVM